MWKAILLLAAQLPSIHYVAGARVFLRKMRCAGVGRALPFKDSEHRQKARSVAQVCALVSVASSKALWRTPGTRGASISRAPVQCALAANDGHGDFRDSAARRERNSFPLDNGLELVL
jgi:hypothetical protein